MALAVDGDGSSFIVDQNSRRNLPKVKPLYVRMVIAAIEAQGTWTNGTDGDLETPLIDNKDCAYVILMENRSWWNRTTYNQGNHKLENQFRVIFINTCRLYNPVCSLGQELEVPVYKFVKEALIRRFGEDWYLELEKVAEELKNKI
jgi:hypothetical protein